jgi:hypothetical protein
MATYYLKATDEQALWTALEAADLAVKDYDPEDPLNSRPDDLSMEEEWSGPSGAYEWRSLEPMLDIIGTIYQPTGETLTDDDGNEFPEMAAIEGYHANLRAGLSAAQQAALPIMTKTPKNPVRKWAGDE